MDYTQSDKVYESDKIYAFDTLYTSNQIQLLKIILPYANPSMRRHLAIFIKYMELQYILRLPKTSFPNTCPTSSNFSTATVLEEIKPLCPPEGKQQLDQISNMIQTMEMMSQMQDLMGMMGGDDFGDGFGDMGNMSDILSGMLSPEQMAMFEMFQQQ